jgi:hypothetical protein
MNQRTHSWIAIRAIALLADEDQEKNLIELLVPYAQKATVGAWIPDQIDAKRGGSITDNHVLKMEPYSGGQRERFITRKDKLLKNIGGHRIVHNFLDNENSLNSEWWESPYKGDVPKQGQHLPNRAMALSTMLKDLLIMGNRRIDHLIPGDIRFAQYLPDNARTSEEAAATYFFMLSHFVADASMPCHCDGRKLAAYSEGLHKELEAHWSRKVGTDFEKKNLLQEDIESELVLQMARDKDSEFGIDFSNPSIPDLLPNHDVWLEFIYVCRASFAVASVIAPPDTYPYNDPNIRAPFDEVLGEANGQLQGKIDQLVMHDAVLNTATVWKHVWK